MLDWAMIHQDTKTYTADLHLHSDNHPGHAPHEAGNGDGGQVKSRWNLATMVFTAAWMFCDLAALAGAQGVAEAKSSWIASRVTGS